MIYDTNIYLHNRLKQVNISLSQIDLFVWQVLPLQHRVTASYRKGTNQEKEEEEKKFHSSIISLLVVNVKN